jgi:serine/threonine protein kinase
MMSSGTPTYRPRECILQYEVIRLIGQGGFADVYFVRDPSTDQRFALKLERRSDSRKPLDIEQEILTAVQGSPFFPVLYGSGMVSELRYIAMEVMGPSLTAVLRLLPGYHFSLSTALRVALEMFRAIHDFHHRRYLVRDVKPENFLIRATEKNPIALIDYGLARLHIDASTGKPIPPRPKCPFVGTLPYASVNSHMSRELGRRDDLWSWLYSVVEIATGELPWRAARDKKSMCEAKMDPVVQDTLCDGLPPEFKAIQEGITKLNYARRPEYRAIHGLLEQAMHASGVQQTDPFDWDTFTDEQWNQISVIPRRPRT